MVAIDSYQKLTRLLEFYLLRQSNYSLPTKGYSLMALTPIDPNSWVDRQTLFLSSPVLSEKSRWEVTRDLFVLLQQELSEEQYLEIYNIDLLDVNSYPVQRLSAWEPQRTDEILSVPISLIGGVTSQSVTVIRSSVLKTLAQDEEMQVYLSDGRIIHGKLNDIQRHETNATLSFKNEDVLHTCSFTDIVRIVS